MVLTSNQPFTTELISKVMYQIYHIVTICYCALCKVNLKPVSYVRMKVRIATRITAPFKEFQQSFKSNEKN